MTAAPLPELLLSVMLVLRLAPRPIEAAGLTGQAEGAGKELTGRFTASRHTNPMLLHCSTLGREREGGGFVLQTGWRGSESGGGHGGRDLS